VFVAAGVPVLVAVAVGVLVAPVIVGVEVAVRVAVEVDAPVGVGVMVGVMVKLAVAWHPAAPAVGVGDGVVLVFVAVGFWQKSTCRLTPLLVWVIELPPVGCPPSTQTRRPVEPLVLRFAGESDAVKVCVGPPT
jgi:hypothetical protein